jgi:hypothetical protein
MDYDKYTKVKFEAAGRNTREARDLCNQLQDDVIEELHTVVLPKFQEIISKLNEVDHNLTPYSEIIAGDIEYRDEPTEGSCYLRLACDMVISSGYAHTISPEQSEKGIPDEYIE